MFTYLVPYYFRPGCLIQKSNERFPSPVTLCLILDSKTGSILSWSCSLDHPSVNLYMRALLLLRGEYSAPDLSCEEKNGRASFFESVMSSTMKRTRGIEMDKMLPSLKWKKSRRVLTFISDIKFQDLFLHHFYNWPIDMVKSPQCLEEFLFKSLVARAVRRTNDECGWARNDLIRLNI